MMRAIAAAVLLFLAAPTYGQCLGDFNGDLEVQVNELIIAVNNALNGCTTGACPIDFTDDNTADGSTDCFYIGRWNESCGAADLEARFISDGEIVIVDFLGFDPGLFYAAEVTSPTTASLIGWYQEPDASDGIVEAPGQLIHGANGGALIVEPVDPPFLIEDCDFVRYSGALTEVVGAAALRRRIAGDRYATALARAHAARAQRPPRPRLERATPAQK